ncbi:MAG TPA: OmpA family protein [Gemmatimonadaceae bacterium]|nr:OmpA family protein [Gemmatimonadaceae bacterium]
MAPFGIVSHPAEADAEEEHIGPWPAFVDLFAATTLIMLVFFAVIGFLYIREKSIGVRTQQLKKALQGVADRQKTFSVQQVGADVLIILEERVTFPLSQSSPLKPEGQRALRAIGDTLKAGLLDSIAGIEIVGHADPSPYAAGSGLTNWGISASRAATVAKFLVDSVRLDGCLLIPSGRGEYYPRDTARAARARTPNESDRRIELLLHPVVTGAPSRGRRPGCRPIRA